MYQTCTFFGHRDCPAQIEPALYQAAENLITQNNVTQFYVGNHGHFDAMARRVLIGLKEKYPHVDYAVVLAYMPQKKEPYTDMFDTIFPEELAEVPPRFAISKRNAWMLQRSDVAITYITHRTGGAAQFAEKAEKNGKIVIRLAETI